MHLGQLVWLWLVTAGSAYLMIKSGLSKRLLEWKHRARICPSCGRDTRSCLCRD